MRTKYWVVVRKRDGRMVEGTMKDDGLQSLWPVVTASGEVEYVSVLDEFLTKARIGG